MSSVQYSTYQPIYLTPKVYWMIKIDWGKFKKQSTMAQDEKIFADGFSFKRQENAPDFVIGRVSIKVDDAITFLRKHEKGGWVNLNAKYGRSGNPYMELDTYEPKAVDSKPLPNKEVKANADDDLPF